MKPPFFLAVLLAFAAFADYRPLISRTEQCLVVTTPGWNSVSGTLRRFEKAHKSWRQVGDPIPVVVGRNGLAWDAAQPASGKPEGPVKREGDGRSPAGVFPITEAFGFDAASFNPAIRYVPLTDRTECVDDVNSRLYNEVVEKGRTPRTDWNSSEKMREVPGYRFGAVIGYNQARRKNAGSCIFLHIWSGPDRGTAGCTAMEATSLRSILESLDSGKHPILIQLPEANYESLRKAWRLP